MQTTYTNAPPVGALSPATPRTLTTRSYTVAAILIGLVLFTVAHRLHTLSEPLERDIVTGILVGRGLLRGWKLYVDFVEFKPPGHYIIWAIADCTVGTGAIGVQVVNIFFSCVTLLAVYGTATRIANRAAGLLAAFFWTMSGANAVLQANQPNIEVFINAFFALGVFCLISTRTARSPRSFAALSGLFFFAATFQKHHVIIPVILIGLGWLAATPRRAKGLRNMRVQVFGIVAGVVLLSWLLVIGYFAAVGRLKPFMDQLIWFAADYGSNHGYVATKSNSLSANLLMGLRYDLLFPPFFRFMAIVLLVAIGGWVISLRRGPELREHAFVFLPWGLGTFLIVALPGTFFPHYYQLWLPGICIAAGVGWWALARQRQLKLIATGAAILCGLMVCYPVLRDWSLTPEQVSTMKYGEAVFVGVRSYAVRLKAAIGDDKNFFAFGDDPGIYYYADVVPPSGTLWAQRLLAGPFQQEWSEKTLKDLKAAPPDFVVAQSGMSQFHDNVVVQWIDEHYVIDPTLPQSFQFLAMRRRP